MKRRTGKLYKVDIELDDETNRLADLLCQLHGVTFEGLVKRLINQDQKRLAKGGAR